MVQPLESALVWNEVSSLFANARSVVLSDPFGAAHRYEQRVVADNADYVPYALGFQISQEALKVLPPRKHPDPSWLRSAHLMHQPQATYASLTRIRWKGPLYASLAIRRRKGPLYASI